MGRCMNTVMLVANNTRHAWTGVKFFKDVVSATNFAEYLYIVGEVGKD